MAADTSRPLGPAEKSADIENLARVFARQKAAFETDRAPSRETRLSRLTALARAVEKNEKRIVEAISSDFGNRSAEETVIAEIVMTASVIRHAKGNLRRWMRPRSVATPLKMAPGRSRLEPQPLGGVGIIAPWNYPLQLALAPAATALAAGNRVMIKPSELTPHTSALMRDIIAAEFGDDVCAVVTGGPDVGQAFSATPFDHLLFTGSTAIGQRVAEAAARNLTPVTLELGGKSPVIIDDSAAIAVAARRVAHGKMFNAGQTCIAPDYVLVPKAKVKSFVEAVSEAARALYPEIDTTADYTSIISDRHFQRLKAMVEEARDAGAEIVEIGSANALHPQRKLPFTIVIEPPAVTRMMREEIFGPVLPVLGVSTADEAVAYVNRGERPLALYWFGDDKKARDRTLAQTVSGGVTVNDTLWHFAQENLPFGGVGKSGCGAYHGDKGFETFSHMKPVFYQSRFSSGALLHPPYTEKTGKILNIVKKIG
jgi:coniferyl-aldehyde dehydrogenase